MVGGVSKTHTVFYPARLHSRLPSAAKIIIPWTGDIIVVNHWQPCLAPTVPLVTLYNSLDFPASIATGYRARSQKRSIKFDAARTANLVPKARIALLEQSTSGSETRRIGTRTKKNSSPTYATLDSRLPKPGKSRNCSASSGAAWTGRKLWRSSSAGTAGRVAVGSLRSKGLPGCSRLTSTIY
jgi:hypothetical protein